MRLLISLTDQSFHATKSLGIFHVSLGLAQAFLRRSDIDELHLLGNEECAAYLGSLPPHVTLHRAEKPVPAGWRRVAWDQIGIVRAMRRLRPDWALLPKGFPPFFDRNSSVKTACYVHDIIWEYYEELERRGPASPDTPFPPLQKLYFRTLGLRALRCADLVLTSSQFNCNRFLARVPGARVEAVGIGFPPVQPQTAGGGNDILLFASPFPHKLTEQAVAWLRRWLETPLAGGVRIHIVGALPAALRATLPAPAWVEHGRLSADELAEVKRQSRLAIYFSAYEGFGMPPVECLRSGLPCLASDIPPIRENVPERFLFSNNEYASFAARLDEMMANPAVGELPRVPDWDEVAGRCLDAMRRTSSLLTETPS